MNHELKEKIESLIIKELDLSELDWGAKRLTDRLELLFDDVELNYLKMIMEYRNLLLDVWYQFSIQNSKGKKISTVSVLEDIENLLCTCKTKRNHHTNKCILQDRG